MSIVLTKNTKISLILCICSVCVCLVRAAVYIMWGGAVFLCLYNGSSHCEFIEIQKKSTASTMTKDINWFRSQSNINRFCLSFIYIELDKLVFIISHYLYYLHLKVLFLVFIISPSHIYLAPISIREDEERMRGEGSD